MQQGAVYKNTCQRCKEEGKEVVYIGETAKTPFDRGLQHLRAMEKKIKGHPMTDHYMEDHPREEEVEGRMRIIKIEDKNLYRQVSEGFLIQNFTGDKILNSRGDWGQNLPPTLDTESSWEQKKRKEGIPGRFEPAHPPNEQGRKKRRRFHVLEEENGVQEPTPPLQETPPPPPPQYREG